MGATIRDVAKQAGVGLGTVSRVINDSPLVSSATRQRVLEVIAELQYTPSQIARSLSLGKTLTIATVAPFFTRPSVVERLRGIEAALAGSGYNLVVFNVENIERRDVCLREVPRRNRADGVLIVSLMPDEDEIALMQQHGVPVVIIDAAVAQLPSVAVDNVYGGYLATQHLLELGHTQIAYISDPFKDPANFTFTSSRDRYIGYRKALAEYDVPMHDDYHRSGLHGRYEARNLARELLQGQSPPTAIFAASDTQAIGVLEAARDLQLDVPTRLSVVGFDDIDVAGYLHLTTVRQPLFESGVRGVELLLETLSGTVTQRDHSFFPVSLVVRNTTAMPA